MIGDTDRSSALQHGTREFAAVYERNAYLVYNLALRITVDRGAAVEAACAAFLACLSSPDADRELPSTTVGRALPSARKKPTLEAAGDADAQAMLRATAALAGPERAALALVGLAGAGAPDVGAAMGLGEDAARSLLERAWAAFAEAEGVPREQAEQSYRAWLWAEPPGELWERLYPSFYTQLVRRVSAGESRLDAPATAAAAAVVAAAPRPNRRQRRQARRAERDARREKRPGLLRRAARAIPAGRLASILVIVGAGAAAAYATGVIGATHAAGSDGPAYAQTTQKLTPAQIARLRREEQQASLAYAAQQKLAQRQARQQRALELAALRSQRTERIAAARAAAKRQQAAAVKRAKQLAAQQKAIQAQLLAQQTTQTTATTTTTVTQTTVQQTGSTSGGTGTGSGHGGNGGSTTSSNPTSTQAQQQCMYNQNNGTYVCPQQ